jgi:hypothetical protein
MATNKSYSDNRHAAAPAQMPAIPEPTFRSAILIGAVALAGVIGILLYGLLNGH